MQQNANNIAVLSFYSFTATPQPEILLPKILLKGKKKYIKGTILIANEGFNGSISGSEENVSLLVNEIAGLTGAQDVNVKINYCDQHPFHKLKVKLKAEIVALGVGSLDVEKLKGEYITSDRWDDFIQREDVILVDTRNDYEVEIGTFKGAIDPQTDSFKQFPDWVERNRDLLENKKIAMCCTGGIRCEKSTAYLKSLGYKEVYHLKGGILQYLADIGNKENSWRGECFVFDDRRAVDNELTPAQVKDAEKNRNHYQ